MTALAALGVGAGLNGVKTLNDMNKNRQGKKWYPTRLGREEDSGVKPFLEDLKDWLTPWLYTMAIVIILVEFKNNGFIQ